MTITTEVHSSIGILRMDRPAKKNAFTREMYHQYGQTLQSWDQDDAIKVILLQGAGNDFSSGNDLADFLADAEFDPASVADPALSPPAFAVDALIRLSTPVVAAVEGAAVGFGATMLLHCDRVIMADGAYLLYPFANIGVVPEADSSLLLPQIVGPLQARRLLMDPEPIGHLQAMEMGLATDVCDRGCAFDQALEIARRMAGKSALGLAQTKRLLQLDQSRLAAQASKEFEAFGVCLNGDDAKTALRSFLQKSSA